MACPNCGLNDYRSNKISEAFKQKVLNATQAMQHAGYRGPAVLGFGTYGVIQAVNSLRSDWRCNRCGHRF